MVACVFLSTAIMMLICTMLPVCVSVHSNNAARCCVVIRSLCELRQAGETEGTAGLPGVLKRAYPNTARLSCYMDGSMPQTSCASTFCVLVVLCFDVS